MSRGAGETAPILFTGAAYFLPHLPTQPYDQFMNLGYHVYVMATQSPDVNATKPILYGTVLVLLGVTVCLNIAAVTLRSRLRGARAASLDRADRRRDEERRDRDPGCPHVPSLASSVLRPSAAARSEGVSGVTMARVG